MTSVFNTNHKNSYIAFAIAPLLLLVAACGGGDTSEKSNQASITNHKPQVLISSPANNTTQGLAVTFTGSAADEEDGTLDANIVWTSNIDGNLGTGAQLVVELSAGTHTITASVSDSDGQQASDSINLTITGNSTTLGNLVDKDSADNISPEYADTGTYVGLTVGLENSANGITYSLDTQSQQIFTIDPQSGMVTILDGSQLEASEQAEYSLVAIATDSQGNSSSQTFSVMLENDNCPVRPGQIPNATYTVSWDPLSDADINGFMLYFGVQSGLNKQNSDGSYLSQGTTNTTDFTPSEFGYLTCDQIYLAVSTVGDRPESALSEIKTLIID